MARILSGLRASLILACLLALSEVCSAGLITNATTASSGNKTLLTSITLSDGRTQGPGNGLIGIDIFHLQTTASPSGTTSTLESPDSAATIQPDRASLLDQDVALNTGLSSPGGSATVRSTMDANQHPFNDITGATGSFGLGLNFSSPVLNGAGPDFVLFDIQNGAPGSLSNPTIPPSEGFFISALLGPQFGYDSVSTAGKAISGSDYQYAGQVQSAFSFTQANPILSLSDFESKSLTQSGTATYTTANAVYRAIAIDFSDLGVSPGQFVNGLFISSPGLDPVFIAGFSPVPEPGYLLPLVVALSIIGRHRRV